MCLRGQLRRLRRKTFARCCACVIIALVLCPFTAPFASYDPNASPIGGVLAQDGPLFDKACDKTVSLATAPVTIFAIVHVAQLSSTGDAGTITNLSLLRSMVLRV